MKKYPRIKITASRTKVLIFLLQFIRWFACSLGCPVLLNSHVQYPRTPGSLLAVKEMVKLNGRFSVFVLSECLKIRY